MAKDEKSKGIFWDDARVANIRAPQESSAMEVGEGDLAIGTSRERILVVLRKNGQLDYGPDYEPDAAAEVFWEAMLRKKLEVDERLLLIQHMEGLLTRIGAQDLRTEALRKQAEAEQNPIRAGELRQYAELSIRQLEAMVHQSIELGRALARRPDVVPPSLPDKVPEVIQSVPESSYEGRAGMPKESFCGECGELAPLGADLCLTCEARHDSKKAN